MIKLLVSLKEIKNLPEESNAVVLFPESKGVENAIAKCKEIIESYTADNGDISIYTYSEYTVRAVEIYCDKYNKFDYLEMYLLGEEDTPENEDLTYSEFGVTSIYDKFTSKFEELESQLD